MSNNELAYQDRLPPHNEEAEQSVIGSILMDNDAINAVVGLLRPEFFYKASHRAIYKAILELHERQDGVDIISLKNYLEERNLLEEIGGSTYLMAIANVPLTAAHAESHGRIVKEKFLLRQLVSSCHHVLKDVYEGKQDTSEIIDRAEQKIFEVADYEMRKEAKPVSDVLSAVVQSLEEHNWKPQDGVRTGIRSLDRETLGFHPGELIILAARPSMGKTTFALNIAKYMAMSEGAPVAFFSLEMSNEQLAKNLLIMHSDVDAQRFRGGALSLEERKRMVHFVGELSDAPLYLDDTPGISPFELRLSARRMKDRYGIKIIFIDYLQLMRLNDKAENRQIEISRISSSLKEIAKELRIPVVALSQLSRKLEERKDKRPLLSDLRESGSLEQDADTVLMLHRDSYHEDELKDSAMAEVIIQKQRNGPTGRVPVVYLRNKMRFENAELP